MTAGVDRSSRFARALEPIGLVVDGTLRVSKWNCRQIVGARHAIVEKACRQQLAVVIEYGALHQRLSGALGDAAMDLPRKQQRIQGESKVVDDRIANDGGFAGVRIDLDLAGMGAVRIGRIRRRK